MVNFGQSVDAILEDFPVTETIVWSMLKYWLKDYYL